jgi:LPXTG-motif cell wall-anchored protein
MLRNLWIYFHVLPVFRKTNEVICVPFIGIIIARLIVKLNHMVIAFLIGGALIVAIAAFVLIRKKDKGEL